MVKNVEKIFFFFKYNFSKIAVWIKNYEVKLLTPENFKKFSFVLRILTQNRSLGVFTQSSLDTRQRSCTAQSRSLKEPAWNSMHFGLV